MPAGHNIFVCAETPITLAPKSEKWQSKTLTIIVKVHKEELFFLMLYKCHYCTELNIL
jgi:hypothetical protein